MENVQLIHQDVNKAKGTMSQEAFVRMCCEVAEHYGTPHKRVPV